MFGFNMLTYVIVSK